MPIDAYIERNGGELRGRASLNEDDVIVLGYREQLTEQALRSVVDLLIRLGTMAHFHDAHAGAVIIDQLLLYFFKYGKREAWKDPRKNCKLSCHISNVSDFLSLYTESLLLTTV